jgi:alkylation response protein AidB-like acyl-CoA dehydrogenase
MVEADAPVTADRGLGVQMIGPTIIEAGSDEQKRQHLGPIIRGEVIWYQGFSEPNAGSDLAALETRAVLDGDEYVITGQKLWGNPRHSDWGAVLARTDPEAPKHRGISYFLVDMKSPGIQVGQIHDISDRHEIGEVYFDNVRVPRTNILGPLNEGWRVANRTLVWERGVITLQNAARYSRQWHELREYAHAAMRNGRPLAEDPTVRERLARVYCDVELMRLTNLMYLTRYIRGQTPGLETSYMKLLWVAAAQGLADLATHLFGPEALLVAGSPEAIDDGEWTADYYYSRAATIYGGTQDIQRNIIAERIFGLPRGN